MIFFDGSSNPNPGPSGYGFTYSIDGKEKYNEYKYIGEETNNVAEYNGLLRSLQFCENNNLTDIQIFGDSLLVVNQVNDKWKIKSERLRNLHVQCTNIMKKTNLLVKWIPREKNGRADFLSKLAVEKKNSEAQIAGA